MTPSILNWTTEAKLAGMLERGWTERDRRPEPETDRIVIRLHHAGERVETFRSLRLSAQPAQIALF